MPLQLRQDDEHHAGEEQDQRGVLPRQQQMCGFIRQHIAQHAASDAVEHTHQDDTGSRQSLRLGQLHADDRVGGYADGIDPLDELH